MVNISSKNLVGKMSALGAMHPRVYAKSADFDRIRDLIKTDVNMAKWYLPQKLNADYSLNLPPFEYEIRDGLRLLHVSQDMTSRLNSLSLAYCIEQNPVYAERAYKELKNLATYPDWNPSHFLDLAQMTYAAVLCYDWIYDWMNDSQRHLVKNMLYEKSLLIYKEVYENFSSGKEFVAGKVIGGWTRSAGNWNFWCNGAAIALAISLGDAYPEICAFVAQNALESLSIAMDCYAPDGGFAEGVSYGMAANSFWAQLTWALIVAFDDDFGMLDAPGMADFAYFVQYMTGTVTGFNFHDAGGNVKHYYSNGFFVANQKNVPDLGAIRAECLKEGRAKPNLFDLLWYKPQNYSSGVLALERDKIFRKVETGSMRSSWNDPDAIWLAFHGGNTDVAHTHLDAGSFVIDALGENWALDLGTEPLSYFGAREQIGNPFMLYRLSSEGHNTIVINPNKTEETQCMTSFCPITKFESTDAGAFAVMDLTPAYTRQENDNTWDLHARIDKEERALYTTKAKSALRGFALADDRSAVIIQDEWELVGSSDFWWSMHTDASIEILADGKTAFLSKHGKVMRATLVETCNSDVHFGYMNAEPLPGGPTNEYQTVNKGINKLIIHIPNASEVKLCVRFDFSKLSKEPTGGIAKFIPLKDWEINQVSGGTI